jgi:hypothetical protein
MKTAAAIPVKPIPRDIRSEKHMIALFLFDTIEYTIHLDFIINELN